MADTETTNQAVVQEATQGTTPTEYSYTFADGRVFKDTDPAELAKKVGSRYDELFGHTKTVERENAQYRNIIEGIKSQNTAHEKTNGFDQAKYYEMWANNPIEAQRYANQYDPEYQQAVQKLQQTEWQNQGAIFKENNPDFPVTDEAIGKLASVADELYPNVEVLTAKQMEATWAYAKQHNLIEVSKVEEKPAVPQPPPVAPKATTSQPTQAVDPYKMTQDELRAFIESEAAKQQ